MYSGGSQALRTNADETAFFSARFYHGGRNLL
jgi:hypothetical protein